MPEDGGLINQALIGLKTVNACVHTCTKPQTSSTRSRGLGWRIHESVEDTKLSTNKQHTLSTYRPSVIYLIVNKLLSLHPHQHIHYKSQPLQLWRLWRELRWYRGPTVCAKSSICSLLFPADVAAFGRPAGLRVDRQRHAALMVSAGLERRRPPAAGRTGRARRRRDSVGAGAARWQGARTRSRV